MMAEHILLGIIAATAPTIAALAAWRNTRAVGNGWTRDVTEKLGRIEGLVEAHMGDSRAHRGAE